MALFKPALTRTLRHRTANDIVVGLLIAFSLANFIMFVTESIGVPGWASWWSITWRQLVGLLISLIIAEMISRLARD